MRFHGREPHHGGQNKKLSEPQEEAVKLFLDRCIELGRPAKKRYIRQAANSILQAVTDAPKTIAVSKDWTRRFIKRNPQYHRRRTKPLSAEHQAAQERTEIEKHFQFFQKLMLDLDIRLEDVWNFDETGFRIGCLLGQIVFTHTENKAVYISDPENRELVTSMECISASGETIDPMVILQGIIFKEKHFDNNLDGRTLMAMSESGYTNDMLSYEWIKHFDMQTREKAAGRRRLLIMDGHGSHHTKEFISYCINNKITPYLLPPHTTHLLQPLDIGVFQSFKHHHQEILEESIRFGGIEYEKADFLASF